jgi:hypothetical protein
VGDVGWRITAPQHVCIAAVPLGEEFFTDSIMTALCPGQDWAWNEYHQRLCPVLPSILYSFRVSKLSDHQRHAALLLAKLVALYFSGDSEEAKAARTCLHSKLDLTAAQIRIDIGSPLDQDSLTTFFSLLPAELPDEDEVILDILHDKLRTPMLDLRFLLERFQKNNHVLSDERLRPFAHAVL